MSEESNSNSTLPPIKDWAEIQIAQTSKLYEASLDQHASLYRWLLAARLAVNGGAAVAIAGMDQLAPLPKLIAIAILALGVVFSILAAELDQRALQLGIPSNIEALGFFVMLKNDGIYDAKAWDAIIEDSKLAARAGAPGKWFGWCALITFVAGIAVALVALAESSTASCGNEASNDR